MTQSTTADGRLPIRRALVSVYDKTGLEELARSLHEAGVEIVSTGSTAARIAAAGVPVVEVAELTGFPECLDGRVKTLHPRVHAGILADLRLPEHRAQLAELGVEPFGLVVVNLYPFVDTVASGASPDECVEQIDIGGPSMVRAAAKNHPSVAVVTSPEVYGRVADAVAAAVPKPKAQRNFTDPQSRIMKTSDGSFHQCFNAQAVVDDGHQVIVAAEVSDCAADVANLMPMTEQATLNAGHAPGEVLADAGYCSADNLEQAATVSAASGTEFFIATGRSKHDAPLPAAPRGRIRKDATPRERMARKLTTKKGRTAYARRKVIVEPVFGQMATLQNAKHLLLRGIDGARGEWLLLAACHNLRKLHGHIGVAGLNGLRTA